MFGELIDDLKLKLDRTLRSVVFGAMAAAAFGAAAVCGAVVLFLWISQTYSVMEAWAALGGLFAGLALLALIAMAVSHSSSRRRIREARAAVEQDAPAIPKMLQDPAMLLTGLQLIRIVGIRRLLPLLLVGGVAAGVLLNRSSDEPDHPAPAE
jgi:membrane associated rhomboid family serine protease